MRSFRMGCANRIYNEVRKVIGVKQALLKSAESVALVRLENQLIKAHRDGLRLHSTSYSSARSGDHYQAGYAAGGRVDIHGARTSRMLR
jgi:hypothetical protein